jgi:hypothetical protein
VVWKIQDGCPFVISRFDRGQDVTANVAIEFGYLFVMSHLLSSKSSILSRAKLGCGNKHGG